MRAYSSLCNLSMSDVLKLTGCEPGKLGVYSALVLGARMADLHEEFILPSMLNTT